jgi:hypothetical protein
MHDVPILQIRNKDDDWIVSAKWPNGQIEEIGNFETESAANEWVAKELRSWLGAGGKQEADEQKH